MQIDIYTDCSVREFNLGLGIIVLLDGKLTNKLTYSLKNIKFTSHEGEILAILYALNLINFRVDSITVHTENQPFLFYTVGVNKHVPFENMFNTYLKNCKKYCKDINFIYVKAHSRDYYNTMADQMADKGSKDDEIC